MSMSFDWLKAIQLKPRFLFGFFLLGGLVLWLPEEVASTLGITEIRISLRPWIGLGTLAAFAFWVVQLMPVASRWWQRVQYRRGISNELMSLSPDEWVLLAYCLCENRRAITLTIVDRAATSLVARGLLVRAAGIGNQLEWPFMIPDVLWKHLQRDPDGFLETPPFPVAEVKQRLSNLHHHVHRYHRGI